MTKLLITLFFALIVSGCSGLNPPDSYYNAQATRAEAAGGVAQQPLLKISGAYACTGSDCSIEVYDPRAHERLAPIERGTTDADVAVEAIRGATDVLKFGVGGLVVSRALREVGEKNYTLNNSGDGTLSFENDKHNTTLDQTDIGGDMATRGDSYGDQANTSGQIGNDATHTPTVVNQPAPVVVPQPAPVVVNQPAPIVVQP